MEEKLKNIIKEERKIKNKLVEKLERIRKCIKEYDRKPVHRKRAGIPFLAAAFGTQSSTNNFTAVETIYKIKILLNS